MPEIFGAALMGSGGVGATLTITGVAGDICNITGNGKTYTKTFDSSGQAVFKGLATGEYTVTMTDGEQTSTKTVTVTADYATAITYFAATISITYPATSTCTVANSSGETVASDTNTGTDAKTWTATVEAVDTYTITATATDGSKTKSATVEITAEGQSENVTLSYDLVLLDAKGLNSAYRLSSWTSYTIDSNGITWDTSNENVRACITPAIDLTEYSSLEVVYSITNSGTGNPAGSIGFQTTSDYMNYSGNDNNNFNGYFKPKFGSIKATGRVDLSSMSGKYYYAHHQQSTKKLTVHSIILRRA